MKKRLMAFLLAAVMLVGMSPLTALAEEETSACAHSFDPSKGGFHNVGNPASCELNGSIEFWYCGLCKKAFADAAGKNEIVDKDGDGKLIEEVEISATGHTSDGFWYNRNEDGTVANTHWHICKVCTKKFDEVKHDYWYGQDPANPDKQHFNKCSVCGIQVDYKDHDYYYGQAPEDPAKGHFDKCSKCGWQANYEEHTIGYEVDWNDSNVCIEKCTVCGWEKSRGEHVYENGVCKNCGAAEPAPQPDLAALESYLRNGLNGMVTVLCGNKEAGHKDAAFGWIDGAVSWNQKEGNVYTVTLNAEDYVAAYSNKVQYNNHSTYTAEMKFDVTWNGEKWSGIQLQYLELIKCDAPAVYAPDMDALQAKLDEMWVTVECEKHGGDIMTGVKNGFSVEKTEENVFSVTVNVEEYIVALRENDKFVKDHFAYEQAPFTATWDPFTATWTLEKTELTIPAMCQDTAPDMEALNKHLAEMWVTVECDKHPGKIYTALENGLTVTATETPNVFNVNVNVEEYIIAYSELRGKDHSAYAQEPFTATWDPVKNKWTYSVDEVTIKATCYPDPDMDALQAKLDEMWVTVECEKHGGDIMTGVKNGFSVEKTEENVFSVTVNVEEYIVALRENDKFVKDHFAYEQAPFTATWDPFTATWTLEKTELTIPAMCQDTAPDMEALNKHLAEMWVTVECDKHPGKIYTALENGLTATATETPNVFNINVNVEEYIVAYSELRGKDHSAYAQEPFTATWDPAKETWSYEKSEITIKAMCQTEPVEHTHKIDTIPGTPATCTTDGAAAYYGCHECGKYFVDAEGKNELDTQEEYDALVIPAHHKNLDVIPGTPASCTRDGVADYYGCRVCGKFFVDAEGKNELDTQEEYDALVIPAHHKNLTVIPGTPASCTRDGVADYYSCRECGKFFDDKEGTTEWTGTKVIEALGHIDENEDGVCDRCGEKLAHVHKLRLVRGTAATCTSDGFKDSYVCKESDVALFALFTKAEDYCGKIFLDEEGTQEATREDLIIPAFHKNLTFIQGAPATCTSDGYRDAYSCAHCGKLFLDENGKTEATREDLIIPAGHTDLPMIPGTPAGCTSDGFVDTYKCDDCGKIFVDAEGKTEATRENMIIPAYHKNLTHINGTPATCNGDGFRDAYSCAHCGKLFLDENGKTEATREDLIIPAGHKNLKLIHGTPATCKGDGFIDAYACDICGKIFLDKEGTVEATREDLIIPAGHYNLKLIPGTPAAENSDGFVDTYLCEVCGKLFLDKEGTVEATRENMIIPAGHTHKMKLIPGTPATCNGDGFVDTYQCETCEKLFLDEEGTTVATRDNMIIPAGHKNLTLVPGSPATCNGDGFISAYHCDICDKLFLDKEGKTEATREDLIIPAGHKNLTLVPGTDAACESDGFKSAYHCEICGNLFQDAEGKTVATRDWLILKALGHIDEDKNNKCDNCGKVLETVEVAEYFTVKFVDRGKVVKTVEVEKGHTVNNSAFPSVKRDGYYVKWYTEPDGEGRRFKNTTKVNYDMTVYAHWVSADGTNAKTGDTIAIWVTVMLVAAAGFVAVTVFGAKRKRH